MRQLAVSVTPDLRLRCHIAGISHPPRLLLLERFWHSWPLLVVTAGAILEGALEEETHRQFASAVGWKLLFRLLVSPLAGSGNRRRSRSRGNRRRRHRGGNSLSGDGGNHTERKIAWRRTTGK